MGVRNVDNLQRIHRKQVYSVDMYIYILRISGYLINFSYLSIFRRKYWFNLYKYMLFTNFSLILKMRFMIDKCNVGIFSVLKIY